MPLFVRPVYRQAPSVTDDGRHAQHMRSPQTPRVGGSNDWQAKDHSLTTDSESSFARPTCLTMSCLQTIHHSGRALLLRRFLSNAVRLSDFTDAAPLMLTPSQMRGRQGTESLRIVLECNHVRDSRIFAADIRLTDKAP